MNNDSDAALGRICLFVLGLIVFVILFFATNGFEKKQEMKMFQWTPVQSQE